MKLKMEISVNCLGALFLGLAIAAVPAHAQITWAVASANPNMSSEGLNSLSGQVILNVIIDTGATLALGSTITVTYPGTITNDVSEDNLLCSFADSGGGVPTNGMCVDDQGSNNGAGLTVSPPAAGGNTFTIALGSLDIAANANADLPSS